MGFFTEATESTRIKQMRDEYSDNLESLRIEMRREHRAALIKKDDELAELRAKLAKYQTANKKAVDLEEWELRLERRAREIDNDRKVLELENEHFEKIKEAHEEDMKHHHSEVNDLVRDAKRDREAAREELADAKGESNQAAYDKGYSVGLKDGYKASVDLVTGQRESYTNLLGLSTLAGAVAGNGHVPVTGEPAKNEAADALAQAFARHLTGTIDRVMTEPKDKKENK